MDTASQIREISTRTTPAVLEAEVRSHLDDQFSELELLTGHAGPSSSRKGKRRRALGEEIAYWENKAAVAQKEVSDWFGSLVSSKV